MLHSRGKKLKKKGHYTKKKNSLESSCPFLRLLLLSALPGKDTIPEEEKNKITEKNRNKKKVKNKQKKGRK